MVTANDTNKLAQSASALGAGILGFGLGAKWGPQIGNYAFVVIIIGALFHIYGMYVRQMKNQPEKSAGVAKALWVSAWICLIVLTAIVIYTLL